jgi:serine/threonine-protein kinase
MATPVMSEAETIAMSGPPARPMGPPTRPVARVGDARRRRASAWVLAALSALGVLAIVALVAGLLLSNQNQQNTISVPSLIGQVPADAESELQALGLQMATGDPVEQDGCQEGRVADQNPDEGTQLNRDDAVTINVCTGPGTVEVPNGLEGKTQQQAEAELERLGLVPDVRTVDSLEPEGRVVDVPQAGEEVKKGTGVVLEVSLGNQAKVPNVLGDSEEEATNRLRRAGFDVRVREGGAGDEAGIVLDQDPNGGSTQRKGIQVTIVISTEEQEPEPTAPPEPTATATTGPGGA